MTETTMGPVSPRKVIIDALDHEQTQEPYTHPRIADHILRELAAAGFAIVRNATWEGID